MSKIKTITFLKNENMTATKIIELLADRGIVIPSADMLEIAVLKSIGEMLIVQSETILTLEKNQKRVKIEGLNMKQATAIITVSELFNNSLTMTPELILKVYQDGKTSSIKSNGKRKELTEDEIENQIEQMIIDTANNFNSESVDKIIELLKVAVE